VVETAAVVQAGKEALRNLGSDVAKGMKSVGNNLKEAARGVVVGTYAGMLRLKERARYINFSLPTITTEQVVGAAVGAWAAIETYSWLVAAGIIMI
jgi:hypothetical protein